MNVSGVSFGKRYSAIEVLEVATGKPLSTANGKAFEALWDDMTKKEEKDNDKIIYKRANQAPHYLDNIDFDAYYESKWTRRQDELKKQFPVLKEISEDAKEFFSVDRKREEVNNWVMEQIGRIGKDTLDVKLPSENEKKTETVKNTDADELKKETKGFSLMTKVLGIGLVLLTAGFGILKLLKK